jgi:hypothetical protein
MSDVFEFVLPLFAEISTGGGRTAIHVGEGKFVSRSSLALFEYKAPSDQCANHSPMIEMKVVQHPFYGIERFTRVVAKAPIEQN